jgi:glycosyltransferase involved in cell wall biosynthesis
VNRYPVPDTTHDDVGASPASMPALATPITRDGRRASRVSAPVEERLLTPRDPTYARSLVGLADLPTIVAMGPFDDPSYAQQLTAAFLTVRRGHEAQLVLFGPGAQRATVIRRISAQGFGSNVHLFNDSGDDRSADLVAAADLVALSSSSGTATLLDVLAAGRPVVAPAHPETVELVVPGIAGLVYPPGDVSGMTSALQRLLAAPVLRRGMGCRATSVARRHHREAIARDQYKKGVDLELARRTAVGTDRC